MTLAHKSKRKTPQVFRKYGVGLCVTDNQNKVIANFGFLTNVNFKRNIRHYRPSNLYITDVEQLLSASLRVAKKQMVRVPCEIPDIMKSASTGKTPRKTNPGSFNYL